MAGFVWLVTRQVKSTDPRPRLKRLPPRHLPGHVEQKPPVGFAHACEESRELLPEVDFFAAGTPHDLGRKLPLRKTRRERTFLSLVEQLIEGDLKRARKLFQVFDRRRRVAVLHARDVGGPKP